MTLTNRTIPITMSVDFLSVLSERSKSEGTTLNETILALLRAGLGDFAVAFPSGDGQTAESGRQASKRGRNLSGQIAKTLGGEHSGGPGNEYLIDGRRICIKIAAGNNNRYAVYDNMLDRIDAVYAAKEIRPGIFQLYDVAVADWDANAVAMSPGNPNRDRQRGMSLSALKKIATEIGEIDLSAVDAD